MYRKWWMLFWSSNCYPIILDNSPPPCLRYFFLSFHFPLARGVKKKRSFLSQWGMIAQRKLSKNNCWKKQKKTYWSNNTQGHVQRPQIMIWKSANSYLCWVMRILNTPLQTLYIILIKTTYQCMNTSGKISNCWDLTTLLMFWYHVFYIVVFTVEGNNCVFRGQVAHVGWGRSVMLEGFSFKNMSSGQPRCSPGKRLCMLTESIL